MKIYFAASIRGGRGDSELYRELIEKLGRFGQVLTEHVGDPSLTDSGEKASQNEDIFHRDMSWLQEADAVVAEVTTPSLGVGYEIGWAELSGKPIICLYRHQHDRQLSAMIAGNPQLQVKVYEKVEDAVELVADFMAGVLRL